MSNIIIKNMSFAYDGGDAIFNQVNLNLDSSWKLGLIGRNGRGKTTLLKILQNKLDYQGTIETSVPLKYFPANISDDTVSVQTILNQLVPIEYQWMVDRELSLLGLDLADILDRMFATLSGGERTKVLLAISFIDDEHFILLDEPTNHLDINTRSQITSYLNAKSGFIVISHDRSFLNAVIDHVVAIEQTQLRLYQGNFDVYEHEKALRDQSEQAENTRLKRDINRLTETAREKAQWSNSREQSKSGSRTEFNSKNRGDKGFEGARAARTMKRSKSLLKRKNDEVSQKEKLLKDIEVSEPLTMAPLQSPHSVLLSVSELSIGYTDRPLINPVSFELSTGKVLALTGDNGTGKSALIRALLEQQDLIVSGSYHWASQLIISQVQQDTSGLSGTLADFSETHHLVLEELLGTLFKLGIPRQVFTQQLEQMSEGQKKRVELAKSLLTPAHVFIWDEPLNYLDVFNQEQIEELITQVQPAMLIIEHDQTFLNTIHAQQVALEAFTD
ncbi:ATP-binding cassette domain-containing protein [Weissella ceti]|uniref:ATP-binding cassette domain-containing protein n=1 Tax=Weissella ceti TaxID=759620 RepID=A0ABT3E622_9LACO|nr:ATP-binding cassette domain-containing protein [Weissella ceti]MCW0953864.1 ATP-binding cassette domain-containing protein [Weissella ceti]QVK12598.1 ABC-F family ATP-binding cassette domain-containing protein [Weissella ceti]